MTNKEKIAHLESMHKEAIEMIAYCEKKIAKDEHAWTAGLSLESFKKDVAALKYALKGLQPVSSTHLTLPTNREV